MSGWAEIAVVAFVAQLAVLPGEKGQFAIAGLATRYDPAVVVAAAAAAFGGWTALEIAFGQALKGALPPVALDAFTGALFLAFAVLLWRSAPAADADANAADGAVQSDGGLAGVAPDLALPTVFGRDLSESFGGFLPIFAMLAAGEFGDKTQLVTIGLAARYGATSAIWAGEMAAIVPVSVANAYLFHRFSGKFDARKAHLFAAGLFAFFAADTALSIATGVSVWEQLVDAAATAILAAM